MIEHEPRRPIESTGGLDHEKPMSFVSLGMLTLDNIYQAGRAPMLSKIGGAGTYALVGARLFCPENNCSTVHRPRDVGFVVHAGSDFPEEVRAMLDTWHTSTRIIETPERLTTRAKNVYHDEVRDFAFLNNKIQVEASMLSPEMLTSRTYHLICIPSRCIRLVSDIRARRKGLTEESPELYASSEEPIFVWEPMEGSCTPGELPSYYEAMKFVDVFSPNEHELNLLFNGPSNLESEPLSKGSIYGHCQQLLTQGFGNKQSAVVVRMGASGCIVASQTSFISLPAYHRPPEEGNAKELTTWQDHKAQTWDVTGGGNAFMGGFCIGLLSKSSHETDNRRFSNFELAAIYGSVAASFAIEQVGIPSLSDRPGDGKELWNGEVVAERLNAMLKLCSNA